jgi:hypothetical protein
MVNLRWLLSLLFVTTFTGAVAAQAGAELPKAGQSLTLYTNGPAQVRDLYSVPLKMGDQTVTIDRLPARLNPESLWIAGPAGLQLTEFAFNSASLSRDMLITRLMGQAIRFKDVAASTSSLNVYRTGKLIYWQPGSEYAVVQTDRGQEAVPQDALSPDIVPASVALWPSLQLALNSPKANGSAPLQVGYSLDGLRPQVRYQAVLNPDKETLHLQGWLGVTNETGQRFGPATVQLLAGQPRQDNQRHMLYKAAMPMAASAMADTEMAGGSNATSEAFADYYLINLPQAITLNADPGLQSFSWLNEPAIPFKRHYIFDPNPGYIWFGYQNNSDSITAQPMSQLNSVIEFTNKADAASKTFGQGLPGGAFKVYQPDSRGTVQMIGDVSMANLPKDEPVKLQLGHSFDVLASKKQVSFRQSKVMQEARFDILLKNRKDKALTVEVLEHPNGQWKVVNPTLVPKEQWQGHLRFDVPVPANGEAKLSYTLRTQL